METTVQSITIRLNQIEKELGKIDVEKIPVSQALLPPKAKSCTVERNGTICDNIKLIDLFHAAIYILYY